MKKKYVSRLLAGCLTVTMLTPTGALASVPQPVVTQEASQEAGQENETENKEQAEEYAADSAAEVQTDETEAAENRTAADKSREQIEPQTAQTGEQAEPQTTQTGEQAASEAEPQAQVQPRAVVAVNQWIRNGNRWWYRHADGSYTTNGWEVINGAWYYFDGAGWMVTGWLKRPSGWYYLNADGSMATGWAKVGNTWYYMNGSGAMQTGWVKTASGWYYLTGSGAMATGWYVVGGNWYYSNSDGTMQTGWVKVGNNWYYMDGSGAMAANRWIGNYYVTGSGAMATNTWIGSYWVGADGKWVPGYGSSAGTTAGTGGAGWQQVGNTWYYADSNGNRVANRWLRIKGSWYYFESNGAMATGWKRINGYKYYFNAAGAMVQDLDSVIGRQSSYYITVNRVACQVMVYAKSETGKYDIPVKTFTCSVGLPGTPTPTGTFTTPAKYRWHTLMGPSYGQYCTRIVGGVLFHSVAGSNMTSHNLSAGNYNMLGQPASHGCVRLCVRDAKWIYDNCALGTTVTISDTAAMLFDKPATIKIPAGQDWDPTDPNV